MRRMLLFACAAALVAVLIGTALSSPGDRSGPRTPPQAEVPSDGPFALAASGVQEARPARPSPALPPRTPTTATTLAAPPRTAVPSLATATGGAGTADTAGTTGAVTRCASA
jgi:hypothetical protein